MSSRDHRTSKSVTVMTNDPKHPAVGLKITGQVKAFARIEPRRVSLVGTEGDVAEKTVRIIPKTEKPFQVVKVRAMRGSDISYRLEAIRDAGEKGYALHVKNTRSRPGRYYDKIFLETDSKIAETIPIIVSGHIRPEKAQKKERQ
ncbi:MAG: hypothetical protein ACQERN_02450 [Thermodesulfobacteriota bacterium]